jgi:predicted alpha/beta superfamily hydrolase
VKISALVCSAALLASGGCVFHQERVREAAPQAAAPAPLAASTGVQRATVLDSEQFVVRSKITGTDFVIQVAKPIQLAPPAAGQKWPVTYVLDGTYLFGMMTPMARFLPLERSAQATYVVGIGFPEEVFYDYGVRRGRDLIHVPQKSQNPTGQGGGGAAFERFIKEELRPLIESRYPVNGAQSVLAGHSYGGLFTATVLANDPDAFAGYMIGSPSLQMDPALADKVRAAAVRGHGRVFIGAGANEGANPAAMIGYADALESALKAPGSGFTVARKTFPDETHSSSQGAWISAGLRHVLPPAPPPARTTQ